jgi:hypothetical protein
MPTKDEKEPTQKSPSTPSSGTQEAPAKTTPDREIMEEAKENFTSDPVEDLGNTDALLPEPPTRIDRESDAPEGMLAVNPGFPVGPTLLAPATRNTDRENAAQHIGWVRPLSVPEPMPDTTGWKSWEWAATDSVRSNFDRVLARPGQVTETERDYYDAETCETEYTLAGGVTVDKYLVPTNSINRRTRALTLGVYDVTVPESLAFKLPNGGQNRSQNRSREAAGTRTR